MCSKAFLDLSSVELSVFGGQVRSKFWGPVPRCICDVGVVCVVPPACWPSYHHPTLSFPPPSATHTTHRTLFAVQRASQNTDNLTKRLGFTHQTYGGGSAASAKEVSEAPTKSLESQHAEALKDAKERASAEVSASHAEELKSHHAKLSAKEAEHAEVLQHHESRVASAEEQAAHHESRAAHHESRAVHHEKTAAEQKADYERQLAELAAEVEKTKTSHSQLQAEHENTKVSAVEGEFTATT